MENYFKKFIILYKLFILKHKKGIARFLKTRTPSSIKKWFSQKLFKKEIEEARKRIKAGKFITQEEAKKRLGL